MSSKTSSLGPENAISIVVLSSKPGPTLVRFTAFNLNPKPIDVSFAEEHNAATLRCTHFDVKGEFEMPFALAPFDRISCACNECIDCCKSPGYLIPADLFRIADHLVADGRITETKEVLNSFQASSGAVVGDSQTGKIYRVGTIVPKRQENGRCIFLTEEDRCSIHSVSPFGCAFFSPHMDSIEGNTRSMWGLRQIMGTPAYETARQQLATRDGGQYEPFKSFTPTEETP